MKVKQVHGIECPECGEFIPTDDLGVVLTPAIIKQLPVHYQCGECDELYEDEDEAKECCKE